MKTTNICILVVDDTPANLHLLGQILKNNDYDVRLTPSGSLALASAQAEQPDLILLDVKMPDMNGYEVCKRLKADKLTRNIPVIFISALQETIDKVKAFSSGGVDYITKPFKKEEVLARVRTHLNLRTLQISMEQQVEDRTAELAEINARLQKEIDARKQSECILRASEKKFRLLYEHSPLAYQSLDEDGLFLDVNRAWLNLFGYSKEEVIGRWFGSFLSPDWAESLNEKFNCLKKYGEIHEVEHKMICKNGSHMLISLSGGISYDEHDKFERTHCILYDITKRKRAEESLKKIHDELEIRVEERTSELIKANEKLNLEIEERKRVEKALEKSKKRFELAMRGSSDGLWDWDIQTNEVYYSPSWKRILGYSEDEIENNISAFEKLVDPEDGKKVFKLVEDYFSGKVDQFNIEFKMRHKDGTYRNILSRAFAEMDDDGQFVQFVGTHMDITEQKRAEEELKKAREEADAANRAKSEFLANMSHEIRTPMNAILGFTEILDEKIHDEQYRSYLSMIGVSGRLLMSLINEILDFSKIEAGKMKLEYKPVNPVFVFKEISGMFSQEIEEKGLEFTVRTDLNMPEYLLLDEVRFRQILLNLLGNAVKFTESGKIKIEAETQICDKASDTVDFIFSVEDTGIGIADEQKESIFNAFEQQAGQDHATYGGTGLGLSITRRLVEMMGGVITVSGKKGRGSIFTVKFQNIRKVNDVPILEEKNDISVDSGIIFNKAAILIADDIKVNRMLLHEFLTDYDFEIIEAENGRQAVDLAINHHPDLILMDMKMPVMCGQKATQILKVGEDTKDIPIVAVTASTMQGTKEEISGLCDGYVRKPVRKSELITELMLFLKYSTENPKPSYPGHSVSGQSVSGRSETVNEGQFETFTSDPKSRKQLSRLIDILTTSLMSRWEEINDMLIMDDIRQFCADLDHAAREYSFQPIINFCDNLYINIESYNVVEVQKRLAEFPGVVEKLKNKMLMHIINQEA